MVARAVAQRTFQTIQIHSPYLNRIDEIKAGLAGNLCRCGTYGRIFEAVGKAAKTIAAAKPVAGKAAAGKKGE